MSIIFKATIYSSLNPLNDGDNRLLPSHLLEHDYLGTELLVIVAIYIQG